MKRTRQGVILDVIQRESISSQEMLRQRLRAEGVDVTQATLSRDLKELGVVKRAGDGAYQRPRPGSLLPDALGSLRRTVSEFLTRAERSEQLIVLRTDSGQAQLLAIGTCFDRVRDRCDIGHHARAGLLQVVHTGTFAAPRAAVLGDRHEQQIGGAERATADPEGGSE